MITKTKAHEYLYRLTSLWSCLAPSQYVRITHPKARWTKSTAGYARAVHGRRACFVDKHRSEPTDRRRLRCAQAQGVYTLRRCPLSQKIELMFFAGVARQSFGHAGSPPFGRSLKTCPGFEIQFWLLFKSTFVFVIIYS